MFNLIRAAEDGVDCLDIYEHMDYEVSRPQYRGNGQIDAASDELMELVRKTDYCA